MLIFVLHFKHEPNMILNVECLNRLLEEGEQITCCGILPHLRLQVIEDRCTKICRITNTKCCAKDHVLLDLREV